MTAKPKVNRFIIEPFLSGQGKSFSPKLKVESPNSSAAATAPIWPLWPRMHPETRKNRQLTEFFSKSQYAPVGLSLSRFSVSTNARPAASTAVWKKACKRKSAASERNAPRRINALHAQGTAKTTPVRRSRGDVPSATPSWLQSGHEPRASTRVANLRSCVESRLKEGKSCSARSTISWSLFPT
jgi:hypothetical protein